MVVSCVNMVIRCSVSGGFLFYHGYLMLCSVVVSCLTMVIRCSAKRLFTLHYGMLLVF